MHDVASTGGARGIMTRRRFLTGSAAVMGGSALGALGWSAISGSARIAQAPLMRSTFAGRVGERFIVTGLAAPVSLRLVDIADSAPTAAVAPSAVDAHRDGSFLLRFAGPRSAPLPQGTYQLRHATIGRFALFVVPTRDGTGYEAIFNRTEPSHV